MIDEDRTEALGSRLLDAALCAFDLVSIAIGDRLGIYRALCERPGIPTSALARRTGVHPRYLTEWLEQQAATGFVVRGDADDGAEPGWSLLEGARPVLVDRDDPRYLAPLARQVAAIAGRVPEVAAGARTGRGLPWSADGPEMRESEADLNRAAYLGPLATTWLPAVPELHERLQAGARVADVGCGEAWSAIGIARGYPRTSVDGFDIDGAAIERALVHVAAAGLGDRVRVLRRDVRDLPREGRYDVVTAFECVHDLAFPVVALSAIRRSLAPDGLVLVADMRAEEEPRFPAGPVERLLYGYSIGVCLPDAMATPGSAQTGTVLRPSTLEQYAREAGFGRVEDAGVEHDLWRFWLLAA